MIDKTTQSRVAFAALLHDIGKFRERAFGGDERYLSGEAKTAGKAASWPRHAQWTYDFFISDFRPMVTESKRSFWKDFPLLETAGLAAGSFNPQSREEKVIALADSYSRGFDMKEGKEGDDKDFSIPLKSIISSIGNKEPHQPSVFSRPLSPLKSIISSIGNKSGKGDEAAYTLGKLTSLDSIIPHKGVKLSTEDYRKQYQAFKEEIGDAVESLNDWEQLIRKMKDLLLEYTWCIPASTDSRYCDISLYDHAVTTMAIALPLLMNENESAKIRVCAFGISGIQSFIFQSKYASFRNAAKIFRGRSFIVAFFSTAFEKYLCSRLDLIPFFDVMDAGGNITLILPDNEGIEEKLMECQREIETFLLEKYHATLSIVMNYSHVISVEEFGMGKYKELRKRIGISLNREKSRKFRFALENRGSTIDEKQLEGGLCPACGKHDRKTSGEEDLCPLCEAQKKLGGDLPEKDSRNYLVLSQTAAYGYEILKGYYLSIAGEKNIPAESSVWTLGKEKNGCPYWRINNYSSGKMFEEIADESVSTEGRGKRYLAYVKIDVDSLGSLITDGMEDSSYSVSRFSTLSRTLHHFFNMHVHGLLNREFPDAYTVLSGGDDLFVILPWNQALGFVSRLNSDFRNFASGNEDIHFSVGIVLSRPKEPFALINERANDALDNQAKKYKGKNAISLFGETFSLTRLDDLIRDCTTFRSFVASDDNKDGPLTSGFVYRLYQYVTDILPETGEGKNRQPGDITRAYSTFSKIHYDIARNIKSNDNNREQCSMAAKFILDRFNNYESSDDIRMFKLLLIATMYELRTTDIEKKENKNGDKTE